MPAGANETVVAHLDADGKPRLTAYANDTAPTKAGDGRLTVRHTAAAPAVDVRADREVLFDNLANPDEASDGNLDLAVRTIRDLHSAPAGVPGGEAGLAPESEGIPAWTLGLGVMSALAVAVAARRVVPARVRRRR